MTQPARYRQVRFERPAGSTELLLVRHGESEAAIDGVDFPLMDGHGDPDLSDHGRDQAVRVCERLAGAAVDAVVVTSLRRTVSTAQPLLRATGLSPVVERDLREVHLGEWEGGAFRKHVLESHPLALRMAQEQRYDVIPGAESAADFSRRVRDGLLRVASAYPDRRVAVFTHGGVIGDLLAQATGAQPFAFMGADNASISHLVVTPDRWILRRFNDTTHLDPGLTVRPVP